MGPVLFVILYYGAINILEEYALRATNRPHKYALRALYVRKHDSDRGSETSHDSHRHRLRDAYAV